MLSLVWTYRRFSPGTYVGSGTRGAILRRRSSSQAGVDRTYISALERGVYSANIDMVDKLAAVLDVETETLLRRAAKAGLKKPYRPAPIPARNPLKPAASASNKVHATVRRRGG